MENSPDLVGKVIGSSWKSGRTWCFTVSSSFTGFGVWDPQPPRWHWVFEFQDPRLNTEVVRSGGDKLCTIGLGGYVGWVGWTHWALSITTIMQPGLFHHSWHYCHHCHHHLQCCHHCVTITNDILINIIFIKKYI